MEIEMIALDVLIPYVNNARTHSDEQVAKIAASIREFGFADPVEIDEANMLLAGHGRVMAARKLGLTEVPAVRHEGLSEAQKKAYILANNKLALDAGWDLELLNLELEELKDLDYNLDITGFDNEDISTLQSELDELNEEPKTKESILDKLDICIDEPRTKVEKGDRWQLGKHILICADVIADWASWVEELEGEETLFIPYAGIYAALAKKAEQHRLVIVQPDTYIASLIVDRYIDVYGAEVVLKQQ